MSSGRTRGAPESSGSVDAVLASSLQLLSRGNDDDIGAHRWKSAASGKLALRNLYDHAYCLSGGGVAV